MVNTIHIVAAYLVFALAATVLDLALGGGLE